MRLVTFFEPVSVEITRSCSTARVSFAAHHPYVLSDVSFASVYDVFKPYIFKVSTYDYRVGNFHISSVRRGAKILFYNGSGGFGDQIMAWPAAKILHDMGLEVHILADNGLESCWWHFPWVKSIVAIPAAQHVIEMWEHKVFFNSVVNMDEHEDQLHPVDSMLQRIGIDPRSVEDSAKSVAPVFSPGERERALKLSQLCPGGLGIYQLSATSSTRSLSPEASIRLLADLSTTFPKVNWVAIYDSFTEKALVEKANELAKTVPNMRTKMFQGVREVWAAIASAAICVGPDSMIVHAAGSLGTPCVGMWGPMPPASRVRYYTNHVPIWHKSACQFAPCFVSTKQFPSHCPPIPTPRESCAVIGKIDPSEVCAAVEKILFTNKV